MGVAEPNTKQEMFWSRTEIRGPKAIFTRAQPWQGGAPFYADRDGRGRIVAIVRAWVCREKDWRPRALSRRLWPGQWSNSLLTPARPAVPEEVAFATQGLVLVLLPGDFLSLRPYRQFHDAIRFGSDLDIKARLRHPR